MSGKTKTLSVLFAAAIVAVCAGQSFGQANQNPCGGQYRGEGLKATLLNQYYDLAVEPTDPFYPSVRLWESNITNGNASYYRYMVPGGDCVFLYRDGLVIVGVGWPLDDPEINHDRYVHMRFAWKAAGDCGNIPFSAAAPFMNGSIVQVAPIQFRTGNGFTASRRPDGSLFLTDSKALLNFGALTPGQTYYFQLMVRFMVPGYDEWYRFDTQVKVYYGPFNDGSGGFGWEISPIHEPYYVQPVTIVKNKLVPKGDPTYHKSSVYHQELCSTSEPDDYWGLPFDACYGQFYFPFKLKLERMP